jgi:hypothetical protein
MPLRTGITVCVARLLRALRVKDGNVTALSTCSAENLLGGMSGATGEGWERCCVNYFCSAENRLGGMSGATGLGRRAVRNAGGLNCIFAPSLVVIAHIP